MRCWGIDAETFPSEASCPIGKLPQCLGFRFWASHLGQGVSPHRPQKSPPLPAMGLVTEVILPSFLGSVTGEFWLEPIPKTNESWDQLFVPPPVPGYKDPNAQALGCHRPWPQAVAHSHGWWCWRRWAPSSDPRRGPPQLGNGSRPKGQQLRSYDSLKNIQIYWKNLWKTMKNLETCFDWKILGKANLLSKALQIYNYLTCF